MVDGGDGWSGGGLMVVPVCGGEAWWWIRDGGWSKNIRWRHAYIKSSYDVTLLKPQMQRFDKLCKHFYEVAEVAVEFEDLTEDLHRGLCEYKIKMQLMTASKQAIRTTCNGDDRQRKLTAGIKTANTGIRSPLHVPRKGRPPSNRKMSKVDRVFSNLRKRKHQRRQTLTIDECNVGSSSQMDGKKLRIESSIEVNSCGECRDECTVGCHCQMSYTNFLVSGNAGQFEGPQAGNQ